MEAGKAQPVARVKPLGGKLTPRLDVARHQQARNIDAADAATDTVRGQNDLSEKLLPTSNFDGCLRLSRPSRSDQLDFVWHQQINFSF